MTQTKLFEKYQKAKTSHKTISKSYKNTGTGKHWTANKTLVEEHERFVQYVDLDFKEKKIPISNEEIRHEIKKSFYSPKYPDLGWLGDYSDDSAYDNLIEDVKTSPEYLNAINKIKEDIKIRRKTKTRIRKGIKINDKYYYQIVFPKTKEGKKQTPYRRFYSINTGKQIKTKKANKYMDLFATETLIEKRNAVDKMRKSKSNKIKKKSDMKVK